MYKIKKIIVFFLNQYRLDMRALSLMRIAAALVLLADLSIRVSDLSAHYTSTGVWPTTLYYSLNYLQGYWSFHALYDTYSWEIVCFALHFALTFLMLLGYKTRISTLLVWLFTISLHNRNIYILQAGDDLLRLLLFWGMFLNWGEHFSVDSRTESPKKRRNFSANLGYLLLLSSVYFFTVNLKSSAEWHSDASAVYYALSLDQIRLPYVGDTLYQYPLLMKIVTRVVYFIELTLPVLILWPSQNGNLRFMAFLLILILHLGIGLTLYVGLFFIINVVVAIGLLPTWVFNKFKCGSRLRTNETINKNKLNLRSFFAVITIFVCLTINLSKMNWFDFELKPGLNYAATLLRLDQYWGMFSPTVMKQDGWYVYYGNDSIGRQWDLRFNKDYVDFKKPLHIVSHYSSDRWRKLAENIQMDNYTFLRPSFCKYLLHNWNDQHPEKKITTLNLYFMEEESLPNYKTKAINKKLFCVCNAH